ncbi:MAG: DNA recombination protein RmuC [Candidatus Korobacteraceae bacterium]|jgi:DNA recombination protein RmuC
MTDLAVILAVIAGALLGGAFAALLARSKVAALAERRNGLEQELSGARHSVEQQAAEIKLLSEARAALNATLESERRNAEEKLRLLAEAGEELKTQFKVLAAAALESNNSNFLDLAKSTLERYQSEAKGELEKREKAVETMVKPLADSLRQVDEQVRELEKSRAEAYGVLTGQVASLLDTQKALQSETGNLVKALRDPQTRGRWGEVQLRKVLELSGMLRYCDFQEQLTASDEERRYRPDVIVNLPGQKHVVIDSKVPLSWYLNSLDAKEGEEQRNCLVNHARQVRQHIDSLAAKAYWLQFKPTPEFVVLFIPGEAFFRAALMADPNLLEYGDGRVILASPITLIAMLKTIAYSWNQKNLEDNARNISAAGRDLYKRLCTMKGHMQEMGRKLGGTITAYNELLRSMESRVFPAARKFPDLDHSLAAAALPEIEQLDKTPFELQAPDWHDGEEEESGLPVTSDEAANSAKV